MKLLELIKIDNRFEKSVNLTLDLYVQDKIDGYIPTRSSVNILDSYINEVRSFSGNRATVLIGPYGKGKSHLLLVLLSILSQTCQMSAIKKLVQRISAVNPDAASHISDVMENQGQFLPVLINASGNNSLNQAFMRGLTSALVRDGLDDVIPDNYYTESVKMLLNWQQNFPDTYKLFQRKLNKETIDSFIKKLESYDEKALKFFRAVYPELTSGGMFNPLIDNEVISVYQSVNRILREKHGYAGIYIIFDEFSKYIEGHAVEGFADDMKILQDIPGVTVDTVDYLIHLGKCLCGRDLSEDSEAYKNLMQLRKVIPPEMIGGAAGKFRDLLCDWKYNAQSLISDVEDKAEDFDSIQDRIYEKADEKDALEKKMDRKANIAALRRNYKIWVKLCRDHEQKRNEYIAHLEYAKESRDSKNQQLDVLSRQNEANESVNRAIAYAEAVYAMADRQLKKKQSGVFEQLNEIIAENFDKMFNDGEKYAKLEDDYRIHVYYHSVGGSMDYEEQNLSNGEATAINFVYIVSVLELARRKAAEEVDEGEMDSGIINLPLVLDGPFSTLSNENTSLVAKKLPEFAEQVIIFMLDKDWASSGLEEFVLPEYCYRVNKEEKANSSTIERGGSE